MQKDKVYSQKVLHRHSILTMVTNGMLKIKQAAHELNLSYRQTQNILYRFLNADMSIDILTYQRTHPAWNKKDKSLKEKTFNILKRYPDVNCCHLTDILHEETDTKLHNTTVRNWLIEKNLYQPKQKIRRPRKRFEMASFGQLVQMDTSEHFWLPLLGKETCMIAIEDNHSRDLPGSETG